MLVKEYRIVLPFSVEEFRIGHVFMTVKSAQKVAQETQNGETSLRIVAYEPFENELGKGIFVEREFYFQSQLPVWAQKIVKGATSLKVIEQSWHVYPYIKTVYSCPFFGSRLKITVESRHEPEDLGLLPNVHHLEDSVLKQRIVEILDITSDRWKDSMKQNHHYFQPNNPPEEEDPLLVVSHKTNRMPLSPGWPYKTKPILCAYKLVSVEFNYWGLQKKVESLVQEIMKGVYLRTHRQICCWIDEWISLSYEEVLTLQKTFADSFHQGQAKPSLPPINQKKEKKSGWLFRSKL